MSWAMSYIGCKWQPGGRGPHEFDCWGLVKYVYARERGIELPDFPGILPGDPAVAEVIDAGTRLPDWKRIAAPEEFCAVALGRARLFSHVGVWTCADGGRLLHAHDQLGVAAQSMLALRRVRWQKIAFFKHRLMP